ncbi:MAG: amidohydrolase family protein, partial [Bacteroidales bacterium]
MKKINKYILFFLPVFYLLFSCRTETTADIVLINGTVITVDKDFSIAEAIAIKNDKILAVGSNKEINKLTNAKTRKIDLKGKTVIPGLIDSHCHPEIASVSELHGKVPDVHTISELLEWIKTQAGAKKKGEWIIFNRMFYTRLNEMRPPSLYELDSVAPNNPVFLNGSYGGMINTSAMVVSEINE